MDIDWRKFIHSDPEILLGKPVVKGTRLSVEFILGLFAEGWTEQQVLENYPTLTTESIKAVFEDGSWIYFRDSKTEAGLFRIIVDSKDPEKAESLMKEAKKLLG